MTDCLCCCPEGLDLMVRLHTVYFHVLNRLSPMSLSGVVTVCVCGSPLFLEEQWSG